MFDKWILGISFRPLVFALSLLVSAGAQAQTGSRPNIIFIFTDDVGYGNLGTLFQNARAETGKPFIHTPCLDRLAREGMTLTQHYTASPVCAPSRASLMTGRHQGHCGLRDNNFDRPLGKDDLTLASVLKAGGYATFAVGKWGIGGAGESRFPETSGPRQVGFDHFYGFKEHRHGHTYYHDARSTIFDDDTPQDVKYIYSTDLFTARTKKYITDHRAASPAQPFFIYLAYTAIHCTYPQWLDAAITNKTTFQAPGRPYPEGGAVWPLQPEEPAACNTWIHPDYAGRGWSIPMQRYATCMRRLDDAVGDLLDFLRAQGLAENTLVIFSSDNGPESQASTDPKFFGSSGPFRGVKLDCTEGGVRVPTFAWAPKRIPAGVTNETPSSTPDWMPTLAEIAGLPAPARSDGRSLVPALLGNKTITAGRIYGEYNSPGGGTRNQQQFVRDGDFVAFRYHKEGKPVPTQLYNVMADPHQDRDLAGDPQYAQQLAALQALLLTCRRPSANIGNGWVPTVARPYDAQPLPAVQGAQAGKCTVRLYPGAVWPWVPQLGALNAASTITLAADALDMSKALERAKPPCGASVTGFIEVPETGVYEFTASGADGVGAYVWLHEARLFETEAGKAFTTHAASIPLEKGLHPVRVDLSLVSKKHFSITFVRKKQN